MNVNLLPWREERRRQRDRKMLANGVLIWVLCGVVVFSGFTFFKNKQNYQEKRNQYLSSEIRKLDEKIKEIKSLRKQKENLLVRMEVIQNLQRERRKVVHLFDGTAQSNARVSDLMNKLDSSEWFENPNLNVIDVTPRQGVRLSQFKLRVTEEKNRDKEYGEVN
jgi:type IV pilus assembly protein PilN